MPQPTQHVFTDEEFDTFGKDIPSELTKDERMMGMLAHLSAFAGMAVPFGNIGGPLVLWAIKREESDFIGDHALEALNFQITMTIAAFVSAILMMVLIGFVLLPILAIFWLVQTIMAGIKANEGKEYRYPFTLRLVR